MSHVISITVKRDPEFPDDPEIGWENISECDGTSDGIWQECVLPGCDGVDPYQDLSEAELEDAENDELDRHEHPHGVRDGRLADFGLNICLVSIDGVGQGISDELYRLDPKEGPFAPGEQFTVEADWEGDDDWAVTLTKVASEVHLA